MLQQIKTQGGVHIEYAQQTLEYPKAIESLIDKLDAHRGALFASSFEYPGRYTCWDIGFYNPPLAIVCKSSRVEMHALNQRGEALLAMVMPLFTASCELQVTQQSSTHCQLQIIPTSALFTEEERSHKPSIFTIMRQLIAFFKSEEEAYLGLYGALGYDLIYQFENLEKMKARDAEQRDMVLYLPDEIYVVNHRKEQAFVRRYDFQYQGTSTQGLPRAGDYAEYQPIHKPTSRCDHGPGEYADVVHKAKQKFSCGDLFEVVPSQTFYLPCLQNPSSVFRRMRETNPSPYGFFINLGEGEYLVGASPEMYVRVQGNQVETCPISGTIKRGRDAIEDAFHIQQLLTSQKEESELTMCTDVDRNDKSRICEAGSVQVIGRRQIEMYSRLIHTVDHVVGHLREGFDALDAFLTHMWVVTVTGAPKLWAMKFIEQHEKSPRKWYAGAVGWFNFNGNLNTGLILRTMRIERGIAEIRVGATLLYDSIPEDEEAETQLKASAFIDLLTDAKPAQKPNPVQAKRGVGKRVLLIDHQDSFVLTLANYLRQTGAEVTTVRDEYALTYLQKQDYNLIVLSPGPGKPSDFNLLQTISAALARGIPLFGVCLGLQGIVEYFGGSLAVLDYPVHGKASTILIKQSKGLFAGFEPSFTAGRYHSLYAKREGFPAELEITATTEDGIVMAISHKKLPIHAVQFHPETILSLPNQVGIRIINNLMELI